MQPNTPPPIISGPPPSDADPTMREEQPRPPEKPFWLAWMTVLVVFLALTAASIVSIVSPGSAEGVDLNSEISSIRMHYVFRESNPMGPTPLSLDDKRNHERELNAAIKKAKPEAGKDEDAALLTLFSQRELGLKLSSEAIAFLRKSESPTEVSIAEFYDAARPNPTKSKELAAKLGDERGVLQLVRYHALQGAGDSNAAKTTFSNPNYYLTLGAMGLGVGVLFLGGLVALIYYFVSRKNLTIAEHPIKVTSAMQAGVLGLFVVLMFIGFQFLVAIGMSVGIQIERVQTGEMPDINLGSPFVALGGLLFCALIVVVLSKLSWNGASMWEQMHKPVVSNRMLWVWGVGGYMANLPFLFVAILVSQPLTEVLPPSHEAADLVQQTQNPMVLLILWILAGVVAPFWEEIAFRGFLFRGLSYHLPWVTSAVLSSLAFAAIHQQGPAMWLGLGWVGFMGCLLTRHTGSIWPAIIMHALHNSTILVVGAIYSNVL